MNHDLWAKMLPWARKTALHPGFVKRINGPLGDVCFRCLRYRHRTLGEAWEPSELDSLRHPLLFQEADSAPYWNGSMLQSIADSMRPRESLDKALRRLKFEKEFIVTLKKQRHINSINPFTQTREALLEHASYLMRVPAVKCTCWWPREKEIEEEMEEFQSYGTDLLFDFTDGDDY